MKLSEATEHDKIKAIAELVYGESDSHFGQELHWHGTVRGVIYFNELPKYLTSYDAILPVIQKQHVIVRCEMEQKCIETTPSGDMYLTTPSQLCDALLIATGKFEA